MEQIESTLAQSIVQISDIYCGHCAALNIAVAVYRFELKILHTATSTYYYLLPITTYCLLLLTACYHRRYHLLLVSIGSNYF